MKYYVKKGHNPPSIRIDACARIHHLYTPSYIYADSTKAFKLTLYKKNLIGTPEVGSHMGCADNIDGGKTFTGYGNITNVTVQ